MRLVPLLTLLFALGACGAETPVPDYPFPETPVLEETELAEFVTDGDPYEEESYEEDEDWDDGLDGVDLSMDGSDDTSAETSVGEETDAE